VGPQVSTSFKHASCFCLSKSRGRTSKTYLVYVLPSVSVNFLKCHPVSWVLKELKEDMFGLKMEDRERFLDGKNVKLIDHRCVVSIATI
jgi:hypothetical protein